MPSLEKNRSDAGRCRSTNLSRKQDPENRHRGPDHNFHNALTDITSKLSAKPKSGMNELGLNINIKLTAKADIQADGQVLVGKLNINLKEKGTIPLPFTGTCWDFAETKPGQRWPALGA